MRWHSYPTLVVDGSSVAHVTVAPARAVDAVTALIMGAVRSWGGDWSPEAASRSAARPNHLTHRYFDTDHAIVTATVEHDLPPLVAAARRLIDAIDD